MQADLQMSIWFARDVPMDIPWRTSGKRQRTGLVHEAAGLSSTNMSVVSSFGCGMIQDGGRSDGSEIAEAIRIYGRPKWDLGATLETLTDMRAVSDEHGVVGGRRVAEARRERCG